MAELDAEVAVVGLGSMGSQALWQVARRGVSVIGIEQFVPGHDRGSGHGESRIIRSCYQEGPQYVPLILAAFQHWRELERETGKQLLTENGALFIGDPGGSYLGDVLRTAHPVWRLARTARSIFPMTNMDAFGASHTTDRRTRRRSPRHQRQNFPRLLRRTPNFPLREYTPTQDVKLLH